MELLHFDLQPLFGNRGVPTKKAHVYQTAILAKRSVKTGASFKTNRRFFDLHRQESACLFIPRFLSFAPRLRRIGSIFRHAYTKRVVRIFSACAPIRKFRGSSAEDFSKFLGKNFQKPLESYEKMCYNALE